MRGFNKIAIIGWGLLFVVSVASAGGINLWEHYKELNLGKVNSGFLSVSSLLMYPQQLQVFDDGAKHPIRRMFLPYQSALYSNIVTKVDQLTSLIDCAKLWFLTMPATFKVSKAIVWFSRINLVETLCKKSLRLFTTFSCSKARRFFVLLPFFF